MLTTNVPFVLGRPVEGRLLLRGAVGVLALRGETLGAFTRLGVVPPLVQILTARPPPPSPLAEVLFSTIMAFATRPGRPSPGQAPCRNPNPLMNMLSVIIMASLSQDSPPTEAPAFDRLPGGGDLLFTPWALR
ncbi:hypothetical protein PAPYR_7173 [Paratrimastix pyriformis]|uniref:Uncharacterized protein n=1 Tax=Paratrimastix pyriformis TaxID=342808 RepID=A0ABQ8UDK4_9EUKA|nr:hypothetical protein PAPYR_7173 [Paratrimastix pyriformis]